MVYTESLSLSICKDMEVQIFYQGLDSNLYSIIRLAAANTKTNNTCIEVSLSPVV